MSKWKPCDFDCLNCPRPDCDAPEKVLCCGRRSGEMTRAIREALSPTAYEVRREKYRRDFEAQYFKRLGKELSDMTKEKFEKLSQEEREAFSQKQREYQKQYQRKKREKATTLPVISANEDTAPEQQDPAAPEKTPSLPFLFHVQEKSGREIHILDVMRTTSLLSGEKKYIIVVDTTKS